MLNYEVQKVKNYPNIHLEKVTEKKKTVSIATLEPTVKPEYPQTQSMSA